MLAPNGAACEVPSRIRSLQEYSTLWILLVRPIRSRDSYEPNAAAPASATA
jgi:hypothetical protein